ncbi:beta-propeller fold lactonase family protein [Microbacterium sp. BK668]|uniref:lactonase family protein n=1 Tax=Microbacterium sp. BK668 TaxID=2512118 RepID=UPI001061B0F2|nr:beta-propeller fold lactonase family protein [Microbacterium sp. BK668]TDN91553.1 6-phosphogluconolactonase [Microbacterium sp. BK668]
MSGAGAGTRLFIGTYTSRRPHVDGRGRGIHVVDLDIAAGEFGAVDLAARTPSPSYLAASADGVHIYAVNETPCFPDGAGGVSAFRVEGRRLIALGMRSSVGRAPCHLTVSPDGRYVVVANYLDGVVSVLPIAADGGLGDAVAVHRPAGNASRAHHAAFDPVTGELLVTDLGIDAIRLFSLGHGGGLVEDRARRMNIARDAGPRHLVFAPDGSGLFVVNERAGTITAACRDGARFVVAATVAMSDADYGRGHRASAAASALRLSPDARHLVAGNRSRDSIAVFRVSSDPLMLEFARELPAGGRTPRDLTFVADDLLVVAHQDDSTLAAFRFDHEVGTAQPLATVEAATPVALLEA